jgi:hypothetical protein
MDIKTAPILPMWSRTATTIQESPAKALDSIRQAAEDRVMQMQRARGISVGTLFAFLSLLGSPAAAHEVTGSDPNDATGTDTRSILYRHADHRTTLKVEFFDPLQSTQLTKPNDVLWQLWTFGGDNQVDFTVEYRYRADLEGYFCFIFDDVSKQVKRVEATKRSALIKCDFRNSHVHGVAEKFVVDAYDGGSKDFAPNSGAYHHR